MSKKIHPHSYKLVITDLSGGLEEAFEIYIPALKAHIFGDTINEALDGYIGYFDDEVKRREKKGISMPRPDSVPDVIKQVPLRIPERVYQRILETAKKEGRSFNSFVAGVLENMDAG
jgi:hypothetical protein